MNRYVITMDDGRVFDFYADNRKEASAKLSLITKGRGTVQTIKEVRHG